LSRAAELLPPDDPERIERLLGLSVALRDRGDFDRAAEVNAEAIERAAATGLRGVEARGRLYGGFLRLFTDPAGTDELVATAEAALPVFEELGDDAGLAQALWLIGLSEWNQCRVGDATAGAARGDAVRPRAAHDGRRHGLVIGLGPAAGRRAGSRRGDRPLGLRHPRRPRRDVELRGAGRGDRGGTRPAGPVRGGGGAGGD